MPLDHHWTSHIAIQPDTTDAVNLSEPQFRKSTAITTAELLLINVWNEGDLKRRPMLIKCNCLIAKCWEPILRGFQWNYLSSSQEVHCWKKEEKSGRREEAGRNSLFFFFKYVPNEILTGVYIWIAEKVSPVWTKMNTISEATTSKGVIVLTSFCTLKLLDPVCRFFSLFQFNSTNPWVELTLFCKKKNISTFCQIIVKS